MGEPLRLQTRRRGRRTPVIACVQPPHAFRCSLVPCWNRGASLIFHALTFVDRYSSQVTSTFSPLDTNPVVFVKSYRDTVAWFQPCPWRTTRSVSLVPGGMALLSSVSQPVSAEFIHPIASLALGPEHWTNCPYFCRPRLSANGNRGPTPQPTNRRIG